MIAVTTSARRPADLKNAILFFSVGHFKMMRFFRSRLIHGAGMCLCVVSSGFCSAAKAGDWYLTAPSDCSGTDAVIAAFVALVPTSIPVHATGANAYAEASATFINDINAAGGEKIVDALVLNKAKSTDYRHAIQTVAASYEIPYFVDATAAIFSGFAIPIQYGTAAGLIFTFIIDQLKKPAAAMNGFVAFIAEGGELDRRWKVSKNNDGGYYLVDSLEYTVSLGAEKRRFITSGCTYPVKVTVSEFDTTFANSNKIIKPHGAAWGVFDIDDNKWDSTVLNFTNQDQSFYYFSEDAIENDRVVGQNIHKISFQGGPWQFKQYDSADGRFKSFCPSMLAK
jgi:hypothetical protein